MGGVSLGDEWHSVLFASAGAEDEASIKETKASGLRTYQEGYSLADPSLLAGRKEFDDGVTLVILSIMPSVVVQQIQNTLAVRQILPRGVDKFELIWTYFGYADDDAEMDAIREKQNNLIGPAGLISMEDGEACELVQQAIIRDRDTQSCIQMSGHDFKDEPHLVTEAPVRSFWNRYRLLMDF
jgi:anthranilate 1,2-dioxygenase large subunit